MRLPSFVVRLGAVLCGAVSLQSPLAAADPACRETCLAARDRLQKQLEDCLREVDPRPPDRAAKMRLHCRERYSPPRCDGLPACSKPKIAVPPKPGMSLSPMTFSMTRRGPALVRPSYGPGHEVFVRTEVEIRARPTASRTWLRMDLRLIVASHDKKGSARVLARWDSYAEEQRFIDPSERGLPLSFTLHGGVRLPADIDPGSYRMEADVVELVSKFKQTVGAGFEVRRGKPSP